MLGFAHQAFSQDNFLLKRKARSKTFADSTGYYSIAASIDKAEISKGDTATIEVFITGYGDIRKAKIFVSGSITGLIDSSYVLSSLQDSITNPGKFPVQRVFRWGSDIYWFDKVPMTVTLGGYNFRYAPDGEVVKFGSFIDAEADSMSYTLMTEIVMVDAPFKVHLKIKDKARAGSYKLNFYLTYFNGREWDGSEATLDLKVNTWYESNLWWINPALFIIGLIGLSSFFSSLRNFILSNLQTFFGRLKKDTKSRPKGK